MVGDRLKLIPFSAGYAVNKDSICDDGGVAEKDAPMGQHAPDFLHPRTSPEPHRDNPVPNRALIFLLTSVWNPLPHHPPKPQVRVKSRLLPIPTVKNQQ